MPVGGVVDLAKPPAERHLRFGIQPELWENQHTVFFERIEHCFTQQVIACEPVGVDAENLSADRIGELIDRQQAHGTGSPIRSMTASAESVGFC
jgi:hypothetical protein